VRVSGLLVLSLPLTLAASATARAPEDEIVFVGAYTSDATGPSRVLAIRPDGTGLRLVAPSSTSPRWSPNGAAIVYTPLRVDAKGSLEPTGLFVVARRSGQTSQLTTGKDYAQAWSPNGRWIAFIRFESRKQNLYVVHPDGTGERRLRTSTSWAAWAPDSRRLLLSTRYGLATVDLASRVRAVPNSQCAADGAFSPNGKLIAMSKCVGRRYHTGIAVERVDGSGLRWLAKPISQAGSWGPAWSPEGTRIAFTLARDVKPEYLEHTEIRMVALNGKRVGNLDSFAQDHDEYPAWSPDGTRIVFDRDAAVEPIGESDRLFVGDVSTGRVRQLYVGTARGEQRWRPR
jgi:Tol biopolymer transport system component